MSFNYEDLGDFEGNNHAENHYVCYLKGLAANRYAELLGITTEVKKKLVVPFSHRIVKVVIRQTTSANVDSEAPMNIVIQREAGAVVASPQHKDLLMRQDNLIDPVNILTFGDGFEYEGTAWTFSLYGFNTNRVWIMVYIQRLGRGNAYG
jgi:hypothetical protein